MARNIIKMGEISKEYGKLIAFRMSTGWVPNTRTMAGTQGECCRFDLTIDNGKTVRRVSLNRGFETVDRKCVDYIDLDEEEFDNTKNSDTLWNGQGKLVEHTRYYLIDRKRHSYEMNPSTSYTMSKDFLEDSNKKAYERWESKKDLKSSERTIKPTLKMVKVVNRFKGFKNVKITDIANVKVGRYSTGDLYYRFTFNNRKHSLTIDKYIKNLPRN
jgi:hypothetical protein